MPGLSKDDLYGLIAAGLQTGGATVSPVSGVPVSPRIFRVRLSDGREMVARIYVWECTYDRANHSYHFQLTTVRNRTFEFTRGVTTMVLGYNQGRDVFVAADVSRRRSRFGNSASVYASEGSLDDAERDGVSAHVSTRGEVLVTVRSDMLVSYFEAGQAMHVVGATSSGAHEMEQFASEDEAPAEAIARGPRRRERVIVMRAVRSSSFRARVIRAYGHACAVCGMQLGLVEAAHIVPVTDSLSDDNTDNGIALCALHHRAYDVGLILIRPNYRIDINPSRRSALARLNLLANEVAFRTTLGRRMLLPANAAHRPNADNLRRGVELRRGLLLGRL